MLLQTSKKRAIETTDVTRSFGWDSSEGTRRHLMSLWETLPTLALLLSDSRRSLGYCETLYLVCLAAWQQHDVQELCRVMFDALEQKWKQTEQVCDASPAPSSHDANPQPMRSLDKDKRPSVESNKKNLRQFQAFSAVLTAAESGLVGFTHSAWVGSGATH